MSDLSPHLGSNMLPEYVDDSKVGLNLSMIDSVAFLGCFSEEVRIIGSDGPVSRYQPQIVKQDGHNALAGMRATMHKERLSKGAPADHKMEPADAITHPNLPLEIRINTSELSRRIQERGQLRDTRIWAKLLNRAVKFGMLEASARHLFMAPSSRYEPIPWVVGSALFAAAISVPTLASESSEPVKALLMNGIQTGIIGAIVTSFLKVTHGSGQMERRCYSIIPGFHVDRLAAVALRTSVGPAVKAIS